MKRTLNLFVKHFDQSSGIFEFCFSIEMLHRSCLFSKFNRTKSLALVPLHLSILPFNVTSQLEVYRFTRQALFIIKSNARTRTLFHVSQFVLNRHNTNHRRRARV